MKGKDAPDGVRCYMPPPSSNSLKCSAQNDALRSPAVTASCQSRPQRAPTAVFDSERLAIWSNQRILMFIDLMEEISSMKKCGIVEETAQHGVAERNLKPVPMSPSEMLCGESKTFSAGFSPLN